MSVARMHPDDLAELARLVADELAERLELSGSIANEPESAPMLTAAQVAERFSVSRRWVYEHSEQLKATPVGDGERPRLRFDPARVEAALDARSSSKGSQPPDRPQRRRSGHS